MFHFICTLGINNFFLFFLALSVRTGTRSAIEACGSFSSSAENVMNSSDVNSFDSSSSSSSGEVRRSSGIRRRSGIRRSINARLSNVTENGRRIWNMIDALIERCNVSNESNIKRTYINGIMYLICRNMMIIKEDTSSVKQSSMKQQWDRMLSKWCGHDSMVDSEIECCLLGKCISAYIFTQAFNHHHQQRRRHTLNEVNVVSDAIDRLSSCYSRMINKGSCSSDWMKEQLLESIECAICSLKELSSIHISTIHLSIIPLVEHLLLSTGNITLYQSQQRRASLSQWRCSTSMKEISGKKIVEEKEESQEEEEEKEVDEEEREEEYRRLTLLFERLAEDSNPNVAGPAASHALKRLKENDSKQYYLTLQNVVVLARKKDDEQMLTNKLRLYKELKKMMTSGM